MPAIKGVPSPRRGRPNKTTREAREAIVEFVNGNTPRFQELLDQIAEGIPKRDINGLVLVNEDGTPVWQIPPNPAKAFECIQSLIEYTVPKLGRQEITGPDGGGLTVVIRKFGDA